MKIYHLFLIVFLLLAACSQEVAETPVAESTDTNSSNVTSNDSMATAETSEEVSRPEGWATASHSNEADPNYEIVFAQDKVNQLTITISPENWEAMQANMTELFGEPGQGGGPGGGFQIPLDGTLPAPGEFPEGFEPLAGGGQFFVPGGGGAPGDFSAENPMWVPATIDFNGQNWTNVGVRYKGNSSLSSGWNSGTLKLPFKLDFDQFEDDYPEIDNQRFYGFKQLSLSNNFGDASYLRETITYNLLDAAGLVAAETAFYEVIIDYGEGPVSLGLYTMIEVVDDTVVDRYFEDDSGNIYEGDGSGVSLATGTTLEQIEASFQKENNEAEADWSDIEGLYTLLQSEQRLNDPAGWRANLEAIFDVPTFLEWLAISAVLEHWDTYGAMSHNFYLYNNPQSGQLTWISWDHNLILGAGPGGGGGGFGPPAGFDQANFPTPPAGANNNFQAAGGRNSVTLDRANVGDNWPLIRYLLDDPTYYDLYLSYLESTANDLFNPDTMTSRYQELAAIIAPVANQNNNQATFEAAIQTLITLTGERYQAVLDFLATQNN